jgi:hypothetical protein
MKSRLTAAWFVAGALVLGAPVTSRAINAVAPTAGAVTQDTPAAQNAPVARFSPGVADIVKMVDAKVDPEVVKTYIQNSSTAYNPSATEIIALKDHGVGSDILTAMLQRGAEVRTQATGAASAVANPPSPQAPSGVVNPYAPANDYSAQPVYPSYAYTYPAASYVYPSYSCDYPSYYYGGYGCGYYSPWCWPSFSLGCYPFGSYCGYPYRSCGRGYGNYYGGRGYYGGSYNGGRGYYGSRGYYGGHGNYGGRGYYNGSGGHSASFGGHNTGFHSFGGAGRPATFGGRSGGFGGAGGFSGHAASFSGRGGDFGGHSMGRSH